MEPQPIPPTPSADYSQVVNQARNKADLVVLVLSVTLACLAVAWATGFDWSIIFTALGGLGLVLFFIRLTQIKFLANALRVQNGRHAYLKGLADELSANLQTRYVDIYITQDPYLNAFALGYTYPFSIVLHSAIVEQLTPEELKVILTHEMAHVKYKHTTILSYLSALHIVPVLGDVLNWIFGFWSRRAELSADRLALYYGHDPHTLISALIKVYVGASFAQYMAEEGVMYQEKIGKGFMRKVAQSLETHPFLVTRVKVIMETAQKMGWAINPVTVQQNLSPAQGAVAPTTTGAVQSQPGPN